MTQLTQATYLRWRMGISHLKFYVPRRGYIDSILAFDDFDKETASACEKLHAYWVQVHPHYYLTEEPRCGG